MRTKITADRVKNVLEEVGNQYPDRQDPRIEDGLPARYLDHGRPNCLVAYVLTRLGFPLTLLRALDQERALGELLHTGVAIADSRHPMLRRLDPIAKQLLTFVQANQDRGFPWKFVVDSAFRRSRLGTIMSYRNRPWLRDIDQRAKELV